MVKEYGYKTTIAKMRLWAQEPEKAAYWRLVEAYLTERHKRQIPKVRVRSKP